MLIRLSAANFLSLDEPIEFSMLASKESQHSDRVAIGGGPDTKILQAAAIWGANASGKSNFCKALMYIQWLVVHGTRTDGPTMRRPFKLRGNAAKELSRFELDILVKDEGDEKVFRYCFAVTGTEVVEESLTQIRASSEFPFFSRRSVDGGVEAEFDLHWWERRAVSDDDRMFARFVAKGTKPNQLFLHEAMDRNLSLLAPVFRWFRDQLVIVRPDDDFLTLAIEEPERAELRQYAGSLLEDAGTGITDIEAVEVPASAMGIPPELKEKMLDSIKDEEGGVILRSPDGTRFSVFLKDGELLTSRLVTYRANSEGERVAFELSEESDGTRRVFDLSPLFHELENQMCRKVYIIDEFDRSMHGLLSRALIVHYMSSRSPETRTQLIFATHDIMLMDQSLLRRDEMWIMDRKPVGGSRLDRMSSHKDLRYDKDVRRAYLEGKFSGLPKLQPFRRRKTTSSGKSQLELFSTNEDTSD